MQRPRRDQARRRRGARRALPHGAQRARPDRPIAPSAACASTGVVTHAGDAVPCQDQSCTMTTSSPRPRPLAHRRRRRLDAPATRASSTRSTAGARATSRSATNGHVLVHPTKEPSRSIDLKQLVDRLQLRGIDLPILIRFRDILQHRLGDIHDAFQAAIAQHQYKGTLHLRLPDQGEPAAPGRRGSAGVRPAVRLRPRGRLEAGAAGRGGARRQRHADHLQRLQGRRVHRDGDAGPEDRAAASFRSSRSTPSSA